MLQEGDHFDSANLRKSILLKHGTENLDALFCLLYNLILN